MKLKLFLSIFLFFGIISTVFAQTEKGQTFIGGSLAVNYDGNGTSSYFPYLAGYTQYVVSKTTTIEFKPEFGYFLSKKWSISIQPGYCNSSGTETSYYNDYNTPTNSYTSADKYNLNMIGIGINVRYYYMFTDKIGLFPQLGVSTSNNIKSLSYGVFTAGGDLNLVFFATPKLGINMGFGNAAYTLAYKTNVSTFNLGLNNSLTLGLNYYFGKN